jgi:hypothetical protein
MACVSEIEAYGKHTVRTGPVPWDCGRVRSLWKAWLRRANASSRSNAEDRAPSSGPAPSSQATHNAALPVWEKLLDSHYKLLCTCFVAFIGNMATGDPRPVKVVVGTGPSSWV